MKKQEQKNKTVFHAVVALLAVLAVVLVLYGGGRWLEKRAEKPETRTQLPQADQETVEVDGVTYRKKSRLTTILVMGVDHDTQDSYEYRKAGQADFLRLVVLDDADKTVQQLQIDRDTITPVTVLGLLGDRYEPVTEQICLGYAFGDGRSMAKGQLVNEAWAAKDYTRLDTIKPDGTYQVGEDGFMEFYPEAASLQQAVLQLFYEKVE